MLRIFWLNPKLCQKGSDWKSKSRQVVLSSVLVDGEAHLTVLTRKSLPMGIRETLRQTPSQHERVTEAARTPNVEFLSCGPPKRLA